MTAHSRAQTHDQRIINGVDVPFGEGWQKAGLKPAAHTRVLYDRIEEEEERDVLNLEEPDPRPERCGSEAFVEESSEDMLRYAMITIDTRAGTASREIQNVAQVMITSSTIGAMTYCSKKPRARVSSKWYSTYEKGTRAACPPKIYSPVMDVTAHSTVPESGHTALTGPRNARRKSYSGP